MSLELSTHRRPSIDLDYQMLSLEFTRRFEYSPVSLSHPILLDMSHSTTTGHTTTPKSRNYRAHSLLHSQPPCSMASTTSTGTTRRRARSLASSPFLGGPRPSDVSSIFLLPERNETYRLGGLVRPLQTLGERAPPSAVQNNETPIQYYCAECGRSASICSFLSLPTRYITFDIHPSNHHPFPQNLLALLSLSSDSA